MTMDKNIVFISYGLPCIIVYVLTVISILSIRKQLSSSFVIIYVWTAVVNLLTYSNTWISIRFVAEQWFWSYYLFANGTGFLGIIHQLFANYFYYAQHINSCLLTMDRFFAIAAVKHNEIWKRFHIVIGACLYMALFIPVFCIGEFYDSAYSNTFVYNNVTNEFGLMKRNPSRTPYSTGLQAVFGLFVIISCVIMNIISWSRLKLLKTSNRADRSFFFISFCIFVAQALNVILVLTYCYFFYISYSIDVVRFILSARVYTSDVFSLGPGIYTLAVPGPVRRRLTAMITCRVPSTAIQLQESSSKRTTAKNISGRS